MIDIARLDVLRRHLRAHPEYYDQGTFGCGTNACAAGWTVALEHDLHAGDNLNIALRVHRDAMNIKKEAQKLLGLSNNEANRLFYHTGNHAALALIDALINREKGELTTDDRQLLKSHKLSIKSNKL